MTPDIALLFTKMEFLYQLKQPLNEDVIIYIECLSAAQVEMLQLIYDPRNKFVTMESNPVDSQTLTHGIPKEFNDIFDGLIQQFYQSENEYSQMFGKEGME